MSAFDDLMAAANSAHQQQRVGEALAFYKRALQIRPGSFDALLRLGLCHCQLGQLAEGINSFTAARKLRADSIELLVNLGCAWRDQGDPGQALRCFERVAKLKPDAPQPHNDCGMMHAALGDMNAALGCYDEALELAPDYAQAHYNKGNAFAALGQLSQALASYEQAVALAPGLAQAWRNRGNVLSTLNRFADALASYDKVADYFANDAELHFARASLLEKLGRPADLPAILEQAASVHPGKAATLTGIANLAQRVHLFEAASSCYARALALDPSLDYVGGMQLLVARGMCDWRQHRQDIDDLIERMRQGQPVIQPWVLTLTHDDQADQLQCARQLIDRTFPASGQPLWQGERYQHERIRVAYLSADFFEHATMYLMAGVFEQHDRSRFEFIALSYGPQSADSMRRRAEMAFERFIDVQNQSDDDIARLMREMEIDIAVDLKGHTADSRFGILARRPAPLQVTYLGYPGTSGASYIDYVLADRQVIPSADRQYFSEQIAYLPHCYQPNDAQRPAPFDVGTPADYGLPESAFVFCCFNNNAKMNPELFAIWMRLLLAVEGSVLWLLQNTGPAADNLRSAARAAGVDPGRLVFAPRVSFIDHMARYQHAHLFLDTLPYNAHTTASDALWMGLPVLTCTGRSFAGRVGASLLHALDMPELVTADLTAYEALAVALAQDRQRLAVLRAKIAHNRTRAPLFDTTRSTRALESAYLHMWKRAQAGLPAETFVVDES